MGTGEEISVAFRSAKVALRSRQGKAIMRQLLIRRSLAACRPPLWSCKAVVAEAAHLLRRIHGQMTLLELLRRGVVAVSFRLSDEVVRVQKLMRRYDDVPMSLADTCLVRMAELNEEGAVMTLDHDFRIYRKNGRQDIPAIMPGKV